MWWFWSKRLLGLGFGFALGFILPWMVYLGQVIDARFDLSAPDVPSRIYARPLVLQVGALSLEQLNKELELLSYINDPKAAVPGSFSRSGERTLLHTRAFNFAEGKQAPRRVLLRRSMGPASAGCPQG